MSRKQKASSLKPSAVRQKQMLLSALRKLRTTVTLKIVSTPVVARVRRLQARWVEEPDQNLRAFYHVDALPQLHRFLAVYAKKKLKKKFYGKATLRGKPARNANKARGNRKRRRTVEA